MMVKFTMSMTFSRKINYLKRLFFPTDTNSSVAGLQWMKMISIIADDSQVQAAFLHSSLYNQLVKVVNQ